MRSLLLTVIAFTVSLDARALEFDHQDTVLLTDINGQTTGRLGRAVAVNRGTVFMGAPEVDSQTGATWQYHINNQRNLEFVKKLAPQATSPRRYGGAIVSYGDITAVSYESDNVIELYLLQGGNWTLLQVLEPPAINNVTVRSFGEIMDVEGDLLVVGDPTANVGSEANAGVVMLFGRHQGGADNWGLIDHFLDPAPPDDPNFGSSVGIADGVMVVGDSGNDRAFIYLRSGITWQFKKQLQPVNVAADDRFGASVEADGNYVAVGTLNGNEALVPTNSGSVHMFNRNQGGPDNFGEITELAPGSPEFIDRFGEALRLRGGLLVVGAPGSQQAYVYSELSGIWAQEQMILPPQGLNYNNVEFGVSIDYQGGSLLVGSDRWNDIGGERYGAVFLFEARGVVLCGELEGIFCDSLESQ